MRCVRPALALLLLLVPLAGCDGRAGSSGFDIISENAAIAQALATQQCLDYGGLRICPADESTGPSIATSIGDQTSVDCFETTPGGACAFELAFVPQGFEAGTTFAVLSRAAGSAMPWVLAPSPTAGSGEDSGTYLTTLTLGSTQTAPPAQVQLAVLAFAASASSQSEVEQLNQTAATAAFVTDLLAVHVIVPTATPRRTATPTRTPTATSTPGAADCCQCEASCAEPIAGSCGECTVVFASACFGELLCTQRTATPTITPTPLAPLCFTDNGDGTISDSCTGLTWEKKDQSGGLHDYRNYYPWSGRCEDDTLSLCQPDAAAAAACAAATSGAVGCEQCDEGVPCMMMPSVHSTVTTTIWGWLAQLNAGDGLAGHTDWRIPSVEADGEIGEFETTLAPACVQGSLCVAPVFDDNCPTRLCASGPCNAPEVCTTPRPEGGNTWCQSDPGCTVDNCSCSLTSYYWSTTIDPTSPSARGAWTFATGSGQPISQNKAKPWGVRAVRGRVTPMPTPTFASTDCCQCESSCALPNEDGCGDCALVRRAACGSGGSCTGHTPTPTPTPCLRDNGDGTVTDGCTALMWEKKDQAGGLHDYGTLYTWAGACTGNTALCQPSADAAELCARVTGDAPGCSECASGTCMIDPLHNGAATTIWEWVATLNAEGFAGYSDWRIPSVGFDGGVAELETILAAPSPCSGLDFPCVADVFNTHCGQGCNVETCSCTKSDNYLSATTNLAATGQAWTAGFAQGGFGQGAGKTTSFYVRAVRDVN